VCSSDLDALVARTAVVGGYDDRRLLSREDFDALVEAARIATRKNTDLSEEVERLREEVLWRLRRRTY
jgi:hypothetical protein